MMNRASTISELHPTYNEIIAQVSNLVENTVPVVPIKPGTKQPIPAPNTGGWIVIQDPDEVSEVMGPITKRYANPNIAIACGSQKNSPVVCLDIDGPTGVEKARELGVESTSKTWIQRTGSGNFAVFYYCRDSMDLSRRVRAGGAAIDLITNGYQLIPPSYTRSRYRWIAGHSPTDIHFTELGELPDRVLEWWMTGSTPGLQQPEEESEFEAAGIVESIAHQISEGSRNETLFKFACYLRPRLPQLTVEGILQSLNQTHAIPPLHPDEIASLVASSQRYPQEGINGFPNAVVPSFYRKVTDA